MVLKSLKYISGSILVLYFFTVQWKWLFQFKYMFILQIDSMR